MIQFNLLPDVKLEYIKAQYKKRVAIGFSLLLTAVCLLLFIILLLTVRVAQKTHMNNLNNDIKTHTEELKSRKDLDKVLTIQNQLKSLPALHDQKVVSSRIFDYLVQLTPAQAAVSEVTIDLEANTIELRGSADTLTTVNKFVDTVKFTTYSAPQNNPKDGKAFSSVVLSSFSLANGQSQNQDKQSSYEINFSFDPVIFANIKSESGSNGQPGQQPVQLVVPKIISTRSETEKPRSLFIPQPEQQGTEQ